MKLEFTLPLEKLTKAGRAKYGTPNDSDAWKTLPIVGQLYPTQQQLIAALGKVPTSVKITIEVANG